MAAKRARTEIQKTALIVRDRTTLPTSLAEIPSRTAMRATSSPAVATLLILAAVAPSGGRTSCGIRAAVTTLSNTATLANITASGYTGSVKSLCERGYATAIGIFVPAALHFQSGCTVSSSVSSMNAGGIAVVFSAEVALGFACNAQNKSTEMTAASLSAGVAQVQAHDGTLAGVTAPLVQSVARTTARGPTPPPKKVGDAVQTLAFAGALTVWILCLVAVMMSYGHYRSLPVTRMPSQIEIEAATSATTMDDTFSDRASQDVSYLSSSGTATDPGPSLGPGVHVGLGQAGGGVVPVRAGGLEPSSARASG